MDITNFVTDLMNDAAHQHLLRFSVPTINLTVRHNRGNEFFGTVDTTTFTNHDTGEEIITVPSNIKEISTWDDWKKNLKISKHSPVYRIIKAIFDDDVFVTVAADDEYDRDFYDYIAGYEII